MRLKSQLQTAELTLASLPLAPPTATVSAQINRLTAIPGVACDFVGTPKYGPVSRRHCPQVAALQVALATAQSREELRAKIAAISSRLDTAPAAKVADPLTSALVAVATTFGLVLQPSSVSAWASILFPIVIEVGSSFGLLVARMQVSTLAVPALGQEGTVIEKDTDAAPRDTTTPPTAPAVSVPSVTSASASKALLKLVTDAGGELKQSQRAMAELLQTSKSDINRVIRELSQAGKIIAQTCPTGTVLKLATV